MNSETIHRWQAAGLGQAPYTFLGVNSNVITHADGTTQAGGCCDFCAAGIATEFNFRSADGKTFKVGSTCVHKSDESGLVNRSVYDTAVATLRRQKAAVKAGAVREELASVIEAQGEMLAALPHPMGYSDRKSGAPLTWLDYAKWMLVNAGDSGRVSTLRWIKRLPQAVLA